MGKRRIAAILAGVAAIGPFRLAGAATQDETFTKAFALFQKGEVEQARVTLLKGVEGNPSPLSLSLLGSIELERGDLAPAQRHLERALALEPGLPGARFTLATVFEAEGRLPEAETALERLVAKNSNDTRPLLELARVRNLQGKSEAALAAALEAKKIAPNDAAVLYSLGVLCLQMDLIKDATADLEAAAAIDPRPNVQYALASARIANRDLAPAIQIYRTLLETDPNNAQINYALGATYFLQGNNDSARTCFEKSVALEPNQVESFYYLGLISGQSGDHAKSLDLLQLVVKRQPDHARAHMALGMEYRALGRLSEARDELGTAVRLSPESQKAHYQLGLALIALQQKGEAAKEFETAKHLRDSSEEKVSWQLMPESERAANHGTLVR